ncbi:TetR/AcrR family transcriptional regulator [Actinomadura syzygii]|uniref:TetR/AcrR family transcriptional regulator n=1 Tax=Actinomadura syzygii TaxID=1427538 RepID=A0A5D0U5M1_9ACTN|nr:TetR/AcrR family transcriptional regulator [Actinomadura syzygii]TYC12279.1 TetR/AcrR family transcriptional regulator [Actinomadura syzygii]
MPQPPAQPPSAPRGRPPRISRAEIVEAARRIVDEEGVDRLTMRRLARDVGSTPMAIYHHVRDKEELLVLLLDDYAARSLRRPELPADPRERVVVLAAAIRDVLAAYPWVVELLSADDLMAESALWYVERIIDGLVECGLGVERAVYAYRAIWYHMAGELMIRASSGRRRDRDGRPTYRDRLFADLDPDELPRLASLGERWASLTAEDTYLDGLRALVDGLVRAG